MLAPPEFLFSNEFPPPMAQNLVIVESPAKAKTIEKYLGKDYRVLASYGHVRDLVPKEGAVDPSADFAMRYQVIDRNEKHVKTIVDALKKADALLLATDPDREGEAIAWHLLEILKEKGLLDDKTVQRVVFHEITERAIQDALSHPRTVSDDLVDAQQARRALDYLVGFNLSPLLWRKVQRGLSAGRVQSPALRLIVEREDEIDQFVPREYWSMEAQVQKDGQAFGSKLWTYAGDKVEQFTFTNEADAHAARDALTAAAGGQLTAETVEKKQRRRNPAPPFTTSTLQQEASRKLGFTTTRTMRTAQQLYEGIEIDGSSIGLITYMRTDSVSLANDALAEMREVIADRYGNKALPDKPRQFKTKSKNAQEAHEAVRPTSATRHPSEMRKYLNSDQAKLYELIWKRAMASQMQPALYDTVSLTLTAGDGHSFRATGSTLVEPGFIAVYQEGRDDSKADDDDKTLPPVEQGDVLELLEVKTDQHFTEPPPRYTEASLVKTLEEYDIGRPSTYASIISTLLSREYVELESKRFYPTDIGRIVTRFLTEHFTQYVDYDFTARLEDELDAVSRGEKDWKPLLEGFWEPFSETVESKQDISRAEVAQARELGTDPKSGKPVIVRIGRYGPFAQIGSKDDEDKPKFASLRPGQRLDKITLDEALALFQLPRDMGETPEGEEMQVAVGRFGPYVRYGKKFASLGKDDDPYTVSRERCLELVAAKKKLDAEREIHVWEDEGIKVLNGRYGPYITDGKKNAKIPKDTDPKSLTLEQCQPASPGRPDAACRRAGAIPHRRRVGFGMRPAESRRRRGDTHTQVTAVVQGVDPDRPTARTAGAVCL